MSKDQIKSLLECWARPEILQDVYSNDYKEWANNLLFTLETEAGVNIPTNEIKLTVKDLHFIKSNSVQNWVQANKGETDLVEAVIDAFIGFCNLNKLVVKEGKILK